MERDAPVRRLNSRECPIDPKAQTGAVYAFHVGRAQWLSVSISVGTNLYRPHREVRLLLRPMDPTPILLADDSPTFLRFAAQFMRCSCKEEVIVIGTASDAPEVLAKAQVLQPQVILLDLLRSDMTGLETIPRLRKILPDAGIIVLTMLNPGAYRQAALAAGADDFVDKAEMHFALMPAIRRVVVKKGGRGHALCCHTPPDTAGT